MRRIFDAYMKGLVIIMKKLISLILVLALSISAMFLLASCDGKEASDDGKLKIGVIQYMSHPSLDNCYAGIKAALEASDLEYEIDFQVGSATSADTDCTNFAKNMVADGCDMLIAIATPAAKSAFAATADTDIPVIFCAVSDPVAAGLVESNEKPGDLCTGTSDVLDLEAQIDMILAMQPHVKSIGILYTSSEDNSLSNLARFKEICQERKIEVVSKSVQNASDIPAAAEDVASKVDCINNFTDNNVVENLSVVLNAADKHGIPVYGSEEEQVKNGCLASVSIDYVALGKTTGEMAIEALKGASVAEMPVRTITEATPVVNTEVLAALEMTLPESFSDAATVTTNK